MRFDNLIIRATATAFLILVLARPTIAGMPVPSPTQSSVDPCLVICPSGDFTFHVTVRDQIGAPIPGSSVATRLRMEDRSPLLPSPHRIKTDHSPSTRPTSRSAPRDLDRTTTGGC